MNFFRRSLSTFESSFECETTDIWLVHRVRHLKEKTKHFICTQIFRPFCDDDVALVVQVMKSPVRVTEWKRAIGVGTLRDAKHLLIASNLVCRTNYIASWGCCAESVFIVDKGQERSYLNALCKKYTIYIINICYSLTSRIPRRTIVAFLLVIINTHRLFF